MTTSTNSLGVKNGFCRDSDVSNFIITKQKNLFSCDIDIYYLIITRENVFSCDNTFSYLFIT